MAEQTTSGTGDATAGLRYASPQGRWVIAATVLGSGIAMLDATVVGIALPAIGRDYDAGMAALQWVVNAYTLTLAGLLLLGGALGDRYGRRRVFLVGVVWFGVASLLCAVAWSAEVLILARALQGVGGALLTPGSLAILQASFCPEDRARAIGAWSGLGGVSGAIGPFLGGYLIDAMSWRLIFFINLPLVAAVILISIRHVPESHDPSVSGRVDAPGAVLAALGLAALTYGLTAAPDQGWGSVQVSGTLVAGALLLTAFVVAEGRERHPMLPLDIFRSTQFTAANIITFVVYGALSGALFLLPIALQQAAGYSPLQSGAALLPITLIMLLFSARSGALAARIGPRLQMSVGPLVVGAGMALFTRLDESGGYLTQVLPAVVVLGFGLAITVAPLTVTVLAAAPAEHAGIASAVNNDVARAAGLIAVAVLPAAAGIAGNAYLDPDLFVTGFHRAVLIAAVACAAGGVLAALTIRNQTASHQTRQVSGEIHCPLDAPPLQGHSELAASRGAGRPAG
jgi:EmrB/QacA subfamily drug resistance transporter